jgi:hypothetical protein
MRKEYDFSNGERGKFHGKVDTKNPIVESDEEDLTNNIEKVDSLKNSVQKNKCSN